MVQELVFRAVIEVLGKPKEHVESSLQGYVQKLKEDSRYSIIEEEFAEVKKQEEQELWITFAELEIKTEKAEHILSFCYDYMPSLIEIIEPEEITLRDVDLSSFLNDLQARLHHVDMVAKQVKSENDMLRRNVGHLLKNYVVVLLREGNLTGEQLSKLTGVPKDELEDFLDRLIDEGRIDLKEGIYYIKNSTNIKKEQVPQT